MRKDKFDILAKLTLLTTITDDIEEIIYIYKNNVGDVEKFLIQLENPTIAVEMMKNVQFDTRDCLSYEICPNGGRNTRWGT